MPVGHVNVSLRRYRCNFVSLTKTNKNVNAFSNNTNRPSFLITEPFLYATLVRNSIGRSSCKTTKFINKQLNAFGRWEGAPGGSQKAILNAF